ncbi:MAG: acylphosphatase, partial [Candidatus Hydrothermarchaeota archaeon]
VIVYIDGEKIEEFKKFARENYPEHASVSEVKLEEYKGHIMSVIDYMHFMQVEQLNKGIPAILDIRENTGKMLDKQDKMLEKQDKMLEKQDKMLEHTSRITIIEKEIRGLRADLT